MAKFNAYQHVTDQILGLMEKHGSGWTKPWVDAEHGTIAVNAKTGAPYRGINQALLMFCTEFSDPRWGTYKCWQEKGAQVRKGEKGTQIIFFKQVETKDKATDEKKVIPLARVYTVFNANQCDGVEALPVVEMPSEAERIKSVERFVAGTGAQLRYGKEGAYYSPIADYVGMPALEQFRATKNSTATENHYSTLLHELTHWTGHSKRKAREFGQRFGDNAYAFEELVAELGAAFACAALGISQAPREDHAQYLNNWREVLRKDNRAIVTAAKHAQAAFEYLESLQAA